MRKSYGDFEAVKGIDLQVAQGEIFSLLGPNGAGKTTTVEILEGHRRRSAGDVAVLGHDPGKQDKDFKARIGIVLQETGVERFLTVVEAIDRFRGFYPKPRPLDEIIEVVGLGAKRDERVRKLSGGQQRRLDVAIGLAGDPELLFLDEPTTGFDPSVRRNVWDMVANLKELGKTVFLTTHYMDEAQHLADRVAIIVNGTIVAEGPPAALVGAEAATTFIAFRLPGGAELPADLVHASTREHDRVVLETSDPVRTLHALTTWAIRNEVALVGLSVTQPSLEDVYLQLDGSTGGGRDMSAVALTLRQFGYENKAFWRNPAAAFFTFGFPIMFLVIFNGLFSDATEFYVPAIGAFAVISACFTNVAMGVTIARDQGVLKRVRGTPMPAASYLVGRVLHATFIAAILVAITVAAGALLYDVDPPSNLGRFLPTLVIGASAFCALGLAITSVIPNEEAAPAIVNAAVLPLAFISDVFVDSTEAPRWLHTVADVFPIKHFAQAMSASFDPTFREWSNNDLVVLAIWGVVGLALALRFFMGTAPLTDRPAGAPLAPLVRDDHVLFRLADWDAAMEVVELGQEVMRPRLGPRFAFDEDAGEWRLRFARPDADRMEYMFHLVHRDGGEEWINDPGNPLVAPGPFGAKSAIEWPEYEAPAWLAQEEGPPGTKNELTVTTRMPRASFRIIVWASPGLDDDRPAPLLVAHDGPEYDELSSLTRLLEVRCASGDLPPLRAALIAPVDRDHSYSASAAYSRAFAYDLLPAIERAAPIPHGRSMRVGMGASLGGLAMLHIHRTGPATFGGLFLQSGSFFRQRFDKQESGFPHFRRISRFMGQVLTAEMWAHPIATTMTCGTIEENLANNRATRDALARQAYEVRLVENRDGHNWIGWRDTFDPHLVDLLQRMWS